MRLIYSVIAICFLGSATVLAQVTITGSVLEKGSSDGIVGASVLEVGTQNGTVTDRDGNFSLKLNNPLPVEIQIAFIGFKTQVIQVTTPSPVKVVLDVDAEVLQEVSVVEQRLSQKQKESALTVEAMDALAIKETPALNFYDGLGALKGVDVTAASLGFKIINTRGFNSTSPVRSLQIIDGVDNQAPGLNFSLGNFLGASDLDVANVDIIAGASSAFYGPNAFNGVISMTTKDPFIYPGISASLKVGERNLTEAAVRYAKVFKDKNGEDRFAIKLNVFALSANDWEADNMDPTDQSTVGRGNPGGYDAVNRYGDEITYNDGGDIKTYPGLGTYHRTGIREIYLVDYDTRNIKLGTSFHYKLDPETQLIYAFNFGGGTTVYQGDNRFSLKDILFFQNRVELTKKDKYFIRAYTTHEDAGRSYDAYFTALRMQNEFATDGFWAERYRAVWSALYAPQVRNLPGAPSQSLPADQYRVEMEQLIADNYDQVVAWHQANRNAVDRSLGGPALQPGTPEFQELFNRITTTSFAEGGSMFFDRSALYHIMGSYTFDPTDFGTFTLGGNYRLFTPNSRGTIFSDTAGTRITNFEYGIFGGWEQKFGGERFKASATFRLDKNQNFAFLFSPAVSLIYNVDEVNTLRISFSSAIRNPTLQDQYLYYNVGRALLLGNLSGYDSLVTIEDVETFLSSDVPTRANYEFDYFSIDRIRPERVQTLEAGYRTTLFEKLFIDMNYYFSWYQDFIGFIIALDIEDDPDLSPDNRFSGAQAYRISTNAQDRVTTQGFSIGANYYFLNHYTVLGNYTWNILNTATDDPIIPAFNTPEHKFNIGLNGRDFKVFNKIEHVGFSINYRWVQGFLFEGSPQFTGRIDDYDMLDVQISWNYKKWNTTFKLGASNLLNNQIYQVYGGPLIGRLAYFSILYEKF